MTFIREKQLWLAEPIKRLRQEEGEPENLQDILVHSLAAAPVLSNLVGPLALINAGIRPQKIFQGVHYMPDALKFHQMFPVFRYYHPPSPAFRSGAKVAGKLGGRVAARVIPGIGWGLLAYDVYDVAVNRRLWGFDLD